MKTQSVLATITTRIIGALSLALVFIPVSVFAQFNPFITLLNQPGGDIEGYTVEIKEFYGDYRTEGLYEWIDPADVNWVVLDEVEECLVSNGESAAIVAIVDIYTPAGVLFASDLLSAPVNGTQFASVGSRLLLGELWWNPQACGGTLSTYRFTELPPVLDTDGDGVPDDEDACPDSDLSATIVINGIDTGISNELGGDGCTQTDRIAGALNSGPGNSAVVALLNSWKDAGLISGKQKGKLLQAINAP